MVHGTLTLTSLKHTQHFPNEYKCFKQTEIPLKHVFSFWSFGQTYIINTNYAHADDE